MLFVGAAKNLACHPAVPYLDQRRGPGMPGRPHELDGEIIWNINGIDQDFVSRLQSGGIFHEETGQFVVTRIGHSSNAGRVIKPTKGSKGKEWAGGRGQR